ncbi:MAG: hypothetical protein ACKVJ7_00475 [Candidatus Poseidoniales archaeon]|jgi:hypothetical protein
MTEEELTLDAIMAKDIAAMKTIDENAPDEQKEIEEVDQVVKFVEPEFRGKRDIVENRSEIIMPKRDKTDDDETVPKDNVLAEPSSKFGDDIDVEW